MNLLCMAMDMAGGRYDKEASSVINKTLSTMGSATADQFYSRLRSANAESSPEAQRMIDHYIESTRPYIGDMLIRPSLSRGAAGRFDGKDLLLSGKAMMADPRKGLASAIEKTKFIGEHEGLHKRGRHVKQNGALAKRKSAATDSDKDALVIGGVRFATERPIFEGLNGLIIGNDFAVSSYRRWTHDLAMGAATAHISEYQLIRAINKDGDLRTIDDRTRV